jgi:H+/gluconate symporter-like permease
VRALAKEIAAGRLDLLEHGPWVPAEFLEATMRTATGSGTAALRVCAVAQTRTYQSTHPVSLRYIHVYYTILNTYICTILYDLYTRALAAHHHG